MTNHTNSGLAAGTAAIAETLRCLIEKREAIFGVMGFGYVGLPLAVEFARAGFQAVGFDINQAVVESVMAGRSHVPDVPSESLAELLANNLLLATSDMSRLAEVDVISICVPTPLNKTRDPDISMVTAAAENVARFLRPGQLVILESTTYPGTTRDVVLSRLESSGLTVGEDFFLAFSPERIDPGNANFSVRNTPKVVGGVDSASTALAALFYEQVIERIVPVASPETAEMVKLLENTFRSVNIALVNEMAIMSDLLNINIWEVIDAASTKPFGFMPFYPGPGIGGHCIPLDPFYLSWKMKTLNYRARFIELASEINSGMPLHVAGKVVEGLNRFKKSVNGSNILVVGIAYKPNIDDVRESPALDVIGLLQQKSASVYYHDPHVSSVRIGESHMTSIELTPAVVSDMDCVVIVTNHSRVDYRLLTEHASLIVDTRNALVAESQHSNAILITL